jgi:hypothetical protein
MLLWYRSAAKIHTMLLAVKQLEVNPVFKSTVKTAHRLVTRFNKSCKASEILIEKSGKS